VSADQQSSDDFFARLLCDIMIPAEISAAIRAHGYDVIEARALPVAVQQDDRAILAEAARLRCVVVTCNYSDPQSNFVLSTRSGLRSEERTTGLFSYLSFKSAIACALGGARSAAQLSQSNSADELRNHLWWLPQE